MRSFAQPQNQSQKPASASLASSRAAKSKLDHREDPIPEWQQIVAGKSTHPARWNAQAEPAQTEEESANEPDRARFTRLNWDISRISLHPSSPAIVQAKLAVGPPGDEYEQEADRVADQVMRMPSSAAGTGSVYHTDQPEKEHLRTKNPGASYPEQLAAPPIVNEVLHSVGQPILPATRSFMEQRLGHDFSTVRVHTDTKASESARAVQALAYTVGDHIVFGARQYSPTSESGRKLIAHELAHVVQQSRSGRPKPGLTHEQKADPGAPGSILRRAPDKDPQSPQATKERGKSDPAKKNRNPIAPATGGGLVVRDYDSVSKEALQSAEKSYPDTPWWKTFDGKQAYLNEVVHDALLDSLTEAKHRVDGDLKLFTSLRNQWRSEFHSANDLQLDVAQGLMSDGIQSDYKKMEGHLTLFEHEGESKREPIVRQKIEQLPERGRLLERGASSSADAEYQYELETDTLEDAAQKKAQAVADNWEKLLDIFRRPITKTEYNAHVSLLNELDKMADNMFVREIAARTRFLGSGPTSPLEENP